MAVIPAVDAAAVALAADLEDGQSHVDSVLELADILEQGDQGGQLFGAVEVILADVLDAAALNHQELNGFGNLKAGSLCQSLGRNSNGVGQTVAGLVPHHILNSLDLVAGQDVAALSNQSSLASLVNGLMDHQVAIAGAAGAKVRALGNAGVHSCLGRNGGFIPDHG